MYFEVNFSTTNTRRYKPLSENTYLLLLLTSSDRIRPKADLTPEQICIEFRRTPKNFFLTFVICFLVLAYEPWTKENSKFDRVCVHVESRNNNKAAVIEFFAITLSLLLLSSIHLYKNYFVFSLVYFSGKYISKRAIAVFWRDNRSLHCK